MVASTYSGWLQLAFDILTGLFDRMGLRTNVRKTMGMVCSILRTARVREDESYTRIITGDGSSFKKRERERVLCPECGKELAKGSLVIYGQTQHVVAKGGLVSEGGESYRRDRDDNPRTYRMVFPVQAGPRTCPVEGCSGWASTRTAMKVHFWHRHVRDTIVILEKGNLPHSWCLLCEAPECHAQVHSTVQPGH